MNSLTYVWINMNKYIIILLVFFSIVFTQSTLAAKNSKISRPDLIQAYLWLKTAGEYQVLCKQAYKLAKYRVDEYLLKNKNKSNNKLAIVLDIDETVLSSVPFFDKYIKDSNYSWMDWAKLSQSTLIPGSKKFLNYVKSLNIEIIYVTNRSFKLKKVTLKNLKKYKLPLNSNLVYFKYGKNHSKENHRIKIRKKYDVILYLGDNLGDFLDVLDNVSKRNSLAIKDDLFGEKFIIFPNPIYGGWDRAIFKKRINNFDKRMKFIENNSVL